MLERGTEKVIVEEARLVIRVAAAGGTPAPPGPPEPAAAPRVLRAVVEVLLDPVPAPNPLLQSCFGVGLGPTWRGRRECTASAPLYRTHHPQATLCNSCYCVKYCYSHRWWYCFYSLDSSGLPYCSGKEEGRWLPRRATGVFVPKRTMPDQCGRSTRGMCCCLRRGSGRGQDGEHRRYFPWGSRDLWDYT